ncbi:MAG: glutamate-1-semialdehyde 2,1-aminomutase [Bdellovibrionaceae bacterium]|nr:glutamate-1-semialdehyde 2,1-aminomutase [Pseudobdellovibrionaceae bacterium]MBX3034124.1 glutamate-1-semialdehyde 2,1-aminomutase [Pseudobdellovibrionaceae bacterium]
MNESDQLFERAKKVSPGGVHSPVRSFKGMDRAPVFFKSAEGCHLTSVENRRYVDFCMSFGPLILGHRDPEVEEAVREMIGTAWTFGACEPYSLELAEWLTAELPWVQKLRFVSSGTEAVMSALRVARAATGRKKILKFEGCYHGHVDSLLVKAGSGLAGASASSSAGVSEEAVHHTLVAALDDEEEVRRVFSEHGRDIAAVIIEPLPANFGLLPQRAEYLKFLRDICTQHGSLLIFDEVISGFRVALGGMAEVTGLRPDLVCYGKILGGGFPVGCYGGRADLMDQVAPLGPVYQAGTLSANPVGMRAGLVTLKKMKSRNLWSEINGRAGRFGADLKAGFAKHNLPFDVSVESSLFWIHGKQKEPIRRVDRLPADQSTGFKKLFLGCLDRGIYLAPNAYEVGFLSAAHGDEVLSQVAAQVIEVASELEKTTRG